MHVVSAAVNRLSHSKNKSWLQSHCTYLHQEIDNIIKCQLQLLRTLASRWDKDVLEVKLEESERPAITSN